LETERSGTAYTEARPIRKLGRGLRRRRRLRVGLTQLFYIIVGLVLGLLLPRVQIGFTVPRAEATQMLFAVGAGLLTFIGVVFSLLFLVVQFGTTTFTPRLNLFYTAPIVWHAFSFYTGVVVFAFVAAFSTTGVDRMTGLIPIVTIGLLLVSIGLFRSLQMRAFSSIQLASALAQVTLRGREILDGVYPDRPLDEAREAEAERPLPNGRREVIWSGQPGILQAIDVPRILGAARDVDAAVEIVVPIGEMVQLGLPVAVVHGSADPTLDGEVVKAIRTGIERTFEQDPTLALRVLVDIALRALSPAINDPTTATQVLDSEESLLRMLVGRDLDVGEVTGPQGNARVLLPLPAWEDYVALSFDELIDTGAGHAQVRRRLERLLRDLIAVASAGRRAPLATRLDRLASAISTAAPNTPVTVNPPGQAGA
jgi:uncharacterized membrane protein